MFVSGLLLVFIGNSLVVKGVWVLWVVGGCYYFIASAFSSIKSLVRLPISSML